MNLRNVLRAYSQLRQLTDDETALLETLRAMNDSERELLVESLSPQPQKKSSERVIERCAACDYTRRARVHKDEAADGYHGFQPPSSKKAAGGGSKSKRAIGLSDEARQRLRRQVTITGDDVSDNDPGLCIVGIDSKGETCGEGADHNVHHLSTHPDYHEFKAYTPSARSAAGTGNST